MPCMRGEESEKEGVEEMNHLICFSAHLHSLYLLSGRVLLGHIIDYLP